ncbi:FAD-binding protein [Lacibacter luteus]|uniref:FAD-binding protein n=1 Tax=Lacibacter luteus TaxID=2508719 RepID=A0A4Q1CNC5_9BACT|nr:FAD-binding protein [Lacibacter luteus]RXK62570.1 FAD-binding protein [Lacibacter luteus]
MQQQITLRLLPSLAADSTAIKKEIANVTGVACEAVSGYYIQKQSIDARSKQAYINLTLQAFINEPVQDRQGVEFTFQNVHNASKKVIVVGAGPAGLFAALRLIEAGIKPVIIERGKDVRARRRDLAALNKQGEVNPESNYCFGEGGAGTYSDGKLYTRSSKRGSIDRILQLFVRFGAEEKILYQSHPHIGTNKLPHIITAMREFIIDCGGEIHFETKLTNFIVERDVLKGIEINHVEKLYADAVILATGHSARDIFELLHENKIAIEAKPFALGVRIEHPQSLIDSIQYRCSVRSEFLPPASYSLVEQVQGKGVFSFCMCPGGIIAPAATSPGELVVNGWSPSKRNNAFANSGMVVTIEVKDAVEYIKKQSRKLSGPKTKIQIDENDPLLLMKFQQAIEQKAFVAGGGKFVAPAQRMADMFDRKTSSSLPDCSYLPGLNSVDLRQVLPPFVFDDLRLGFKAFGQKMRGYFTNEAVVVATESRTSSPVRIPRDNETLQHTQIKGLYPCGEGAGYAGGIVSAAMDGERVAAMIAAVSDASKSA